MFKHWSEYRTFLFHYVIQLLDNYPDLNNQTNLLFSSILYFVNSSQETPTGRKKIIPVGSDFEGSPSPETPSSPVTPSPAKNNNTINEDDEDSSKKKSKFGLKWKSKLLTNPS